MDVDYTNTNKKSLFIYHKYRLFLGGESNKSVLCFCPEQQQNYSNILQCIYFKMGGWSAKKL